MPLAPFDAGRGVGDGGFGEYRHSIFCDYEYGHDDRECVSDGSGSGLMGLAYGCGRYEGHGDGDGGFAGWGEGDGYGGKGYGYGFTNGAGFGYGEVEEFYGDDYLGQVRERRRWLMELVDKVRREGAV